MNDPRWTLFLLVAAALCSNDGMAAADGIRLPGSVVPENYRIKILPIIEEGDFRLFGSVRLDFSTTEPIDRIVLHAVNLTMDEKITVVPLAGKCRSVVKRAEPEEDDPLELAAETDDHHGGYHVSYDREKEFVIIELPWTLNANHRYRIKFTYHGQLSQGLDGLYRTDYPDPTTGSKRWLAVSQMEPTGARKAFPCLDEPALKATFEIVIGRTENMTSASNMPLNRSISMRTRSGWYWDYFEKSVRMSTYLVAFLVSDFEARTAQPVPRPLDALKGEPTAVRVWAQRDRIDQTQHALKVTTPMLEFLETYFQVPFPIPKMDLVAVPDFSAGAMENWGLITFRENALLIDPKSATNAHNMQVERIIAHELAHQWFGNLVTMKWWNDLWLNEGFATYVERLVMENVSPQYQYGIQQGLRFMHVLATDALESSHPISVEVNDPGEIEELFDEVSYSKGCAVIRMMNHFLGEATFRQGLTNYLTELKYKNAGQDDLWHFMTQQAGVDGVLPSGTDIKTIMDTWTLQKGFPLITVHRNYQNGLIRFEQERFLRSNARHSINSSDSTSNYRWWVPISFTDADRKNFHENNTLPRLWLSPSLVEDSLQTEISPTAWIVANVQGSGFYRVNYDERNWQLLNDQMRKNHEAIHVLNRAHLISDAFALAEVNILPYSTPLGMIQYMKREAHNVPWESATDALGYLNLMLKFTPHYGRFQSFLASLTRPALGRLGYQFRNNEDPVVTRTRLLLMKEACASDYRPCIQRSQELFEEWMASDEVDNFSGIRPDTRHHTYCTAIKYGGKREWDFAWRMASTVTSSQHRAVLLATLACSREPWLLSRYLWFTLDPESGIRKQDGKELIVSVSRNPVGRFIAFDFIRENFDALIDRYTIHRTMQALASTTSSFNTQKDLQSVEEFMAAKSAKMSALPSTSKKILNTVVANVQWMDRNVAALVDWLKSKGF